MMRGSRVGRCVVVATIVSLGAGCTADLYLGELPAAEELDPDGPRRPGPDVGAERPPSRPGEDEGGIEDDGTGTGGADLDEDTGEPDVPDTRPDVAPPDEPPPEEPEPPPEEPHNPDPEAVRCEQLEVERCRARSDCRWVEIEEVGDCRPDPCEGERARFCTELPESDCLAEAGCSWVVDGEEEGCMLEVCAPCELQELEVCRESPFCTLRGDEEPVCVPG